MYAEKWLLGYFLFSCSIFWSSIYWHNHHLVNQTKYIVVIASLPAQRPPVASHCKKIKLKSLSWHSSLLEFALRLLSQSSLSLSYPCNSPCIISSLLLSLVFLPVKIIPILQMQLTSCSMSSRISKQLVIPLVSEYLAPFFFCREQNHS